MEKFKITLAAARVNAGMTQSEVAAKMHVSKNTIVNWEKGKIEMKPAQFDFFCKIVQAPKDNILLPII